MFIHLRTSISFDPRTRHTVWSVLIGVIFNDLNRYGFNQTQIQRYMCVKSTRGARHALLINAVGVACIVLLSGIIGVILYAYYADCDPYTAGYINDIDQILPYFVMEVLGSKKGLPGVFLACIFSGALSTMSSGLNSLTAIIMEDYYKGLLQRQITDERQGFISKIMSVILGVIVMAFTYVVSKLGSIINTVLSLTGVLSGPIMGIFMLGFFFPRVNARGGLIGLLGGTAIIVWIFLGAQLTKDQREDYRLSFSTAKCVDVNMTKTPIVNITGMHETIK